MSGKNKPCVDQRAPQGRSRARKTHSRKFEIHARRIHAWAFHASGLRAFVLAALCLPALALGQPDDFPADHEGFDAIAVPFFDRYCLRCHGPEDVNGDLRMDRLSANDFISRPRAARWEEILNALNGYQMPPEDEPQPDPEAAGRFTDWILSQLSAAEIAQAPKQRVIRRLNRSEYDNTIRDLLGISLQPAENFPEDGAAGGFDNNGSALTISPLHMELYYDAALAAIDAALYEGREPAAVHWRFEPEENTRGLDQLRVNRDGQGILLNPGNNEIDGEWTFVRRSDWDSPVEFRDFRLPDRGRYVLRLRAYGIQPDRDQVVASAAAVLNASPGDARLRHFREHDIYNYGPPRIRVTQTLDGHSQVIAELDIDADAAAPQVYEIEADYTTETAGIGIEYVYSLPNLPENFRVRRDERFAIPVFAVDWLELEGPIHSQWPPESHTRLLPQPEPRSRDEQAYAREVLANFMPRAYRRPVTEAEIDERLALFSAVREDADSFREAIKVALAAVLSSPHFLFLVEAPATEGDTGLSAYEIASRLSYFLWSSMPDATLFAEAHSGALLEPANIRAAVDRMLADPRSEAFVENFAGQWLGLREVGSNPPVPSLYPRYDRHLETSIVGEARAFFAEVLHHDLDVRNFIQSPFVVVNERLARFYGIDGVHGDHFRRVPVDPGLHRGGLLTQAAMLTTTSNGTRTSPVLRGVWVLRTMLAADPGLPVANVGEIAPNIPGIDKATVRQRLEMHRAAPQCARCHNRIDPLGLALENFDTSGAWREFEGFGYNGVVEAGDPRIDALTRLPDGTQVNGVAGLQQVLLEREDEFRSALAQALLRYALGRTLGYADRALIRSVADARAADTPTLRAMIHAIVSSEAFRSR